MDYTFSYIWKGFARSRRCALGLTHNILDLDDTRAPTPPAWLLCSLLAVILALGWPIQR